MKAWSCWRGGVLEQGKRTALTHQALGHLMMRQARKAWRCWLEHVHRRRHKRMVRLQHSFDARMCRVRLVAVMTDMLIVDVNLVVDLDHHVYMQAVAFRERMVLRPALAALKAHAHRSQLARVAVLRLVHRQLAAAWAAWKMIVQASFPPSHSIAPPFCARCQLLYKACIPRDFTATFMTTAFFDSAFFGAQDMAQRRAAAEALQRRALSRMLGLSLRSSVAAWRRLAACMAAARSLLRRHLLALQQDAFMAWRCAGLPCTV